MDKFKHEALAKTVSAVRAVLKTNPDIPARNIEDSLDVLCGNRRAVGLSDHTSIEKPYTRSEVAALLGKSVKTVDRYARVGVLKRVTRTDTRKSVGYTAESVRALISGKEVA